MLRNTLIVVVAVLLVTAPVGAVVEPHSPTGAESRGQEAKNPLVAGQTNEDPDPVMQVDAPDQVTVGETFELSVWAENRGGDAGAYSTITVSSPSFTGSSGGARFESPQSGLDYVSRISQGEEIYDDSGNAMTAQYALLEAGTTGNSEWGSNEEQSLSADVTAQEAGEIVFYVRTTLSDDADNTQKFTTPWNGDTEDQQGFEVRRIVIDVQEEGDSADSFELSIDTEGEGTVGAYPPGTIDDSFTGEYEAGEDVKLTANPADGYEFDGWEGDVAADSYDDSSIEVTMDAARDLTATFSESENEAPVITQASPAGTVRTDPGEWSELFEVEATDPDGEDSALDYTWQWWEQEELVAEFEGAGATNDFKWDQPGEYRIEVVVSDGQDETTHSWPFIIEEETTAHELSLATEGWGEIEVEPPGTTRTDFERAYTAGTEVQLTATPDTEYEFTGWEGDLASSKRDDPTITVTMDEARELTATFGTAANEPPQIEGVSPDGTVRTELGTWSESFEVEATDPDGDELQYIWKWWDGDELVDSWEYDEDAEFKWDEEGEYRIQVIVSDGEDTDSHSWPFIIGTPGEPDESEFGVQNSQFGDETFATGQQSTGTVTLRHAGAESRAVWLEAVAVGPNGEKYSMDLRGGSEVELPAEGSTAVDVRLPIRDGYPTGEYDLRISAWPTDTVQNEETRLFSTTRSEAFAVRVPRSERASLSISGADQDSYVLNSAAEMSATVENTGNEEQTFTIETFLRQPDGTRLDESEGTTSVTIEPGRKEQIEFQHQFSDSAISGEYDIEVEVTQEGGRVVRSVDRDAFSLLAGNPDDVTIDYVYVKYLVDSYQATQGETITPKIGVSTRSLNQELVVEHKLRGPDGDVYEPESNQQTVQLGEYEHRQLKPDIPITERYSDGRYDLITLVKPSPGSEEIFARHVNTDAIEVTGNSDASISLEPQGDFSAEVTLLRDGESIDQQYLTDGDPISFDNLAADRYTVQYTMYFPGGSNTVTKSIEVDEGQSRTLELTPDKASASGFVEIDGKRLNHATVEISGETAETDANGNVQIGPSLSPGFHTLIVKYDGRAIYREGVEIDPGQNELDVDIEYVDPYPNDEFDGDEAMLGFWCGEFCYSAGDNGHANAEYMLGWMIGAVNPAFDIRDGVASAGKGDAVGVGLSIIGIAPYFGDISTIGGRFARVVPDLPAQQAFRLKEMVRKSSINKKDELLGYLNQHTSARNTLKSDFGLSGDFTKRLSDSRALKLRHAAGRLKAAGYADDDVARFIRRNGQSGNIQKVEEFSHAASQYERATDTIPKTHGDMLEAIWFDRIRKSEGASIAPRTISGGQLTAGKTYVATGVELGAGGELDVVVFTVDEAGNPTVTKAYEVTRGAVKNKPTNQLVRNLERGADSGSDSHHYLDAEAFARQPTSQQNKGYVGFADDVDINIASSSEPTAGAQIYDEAEFATMSDDLGLVKNDP